jgi:hypothetical protein
MLGRFRSQLTYANVMATLAVFIALGGGAYAISLGKNSVRSKQIARDAVRSSEIKEGAVGSAEIGDGQMTLDDLAVALRLRCPSETRYIEGACLETGTRTPTSQVSAENLCDQAGRRLPSFEELQAARREAGLSVLAAGEWTNGFLYVAPDYYGFVARGDDFAAEVHPRGAASKAYRCVAPPLR